MKFDKARHYTRKTIIHDMAYRGESSISVAHWEDDVEDKLRSVLTIDTGACHVQLLITPAEARDLATNLQAFAEEVEAHQAQLTLEEVPA